MTDESRFVNFLFGRPPPCRADHSRKNSRSLMKTNHEWTRINTKFLDLPAPGSPLWVAPVSFVVLRGYRFSLVSFFVALQRPLSSLFQPLGVPSRNNLLPASLLQNSDLHLASHGFPPGSAGVPILIVHAPLGRVVSPWERGRPARILVKALPRRQSAGEPTNPVKPIATTLPSLVRAGRPRSQGSQPFPAINPTYWRILQKAPP